jgi:hypothetical protein
MYILKELSSLLPCNYYISTTTQTPTSPTTSTLILSLAWKFSDWVAAACRTTGWTPLEDENAPHRTGARWEVLVDWRVNSIRFMYPSDNRARSYAGSWNYPCSNAILVTAVIRKAWLLALQTVSGSLFCWTQTMV